MVAELAGVLARAKFAARLAAAMPLATPEALLLRYAALATIVVPAPIGRTVAADADMVIATALAAGAALIVTGDTDLPVMDPFRGIRRLGSAGALESARRKMNG